MATAGGGTTSLWWDMESCPLPSYVDPYIVASMAPALLRNFNIITSMVNAGRGCSSLDHHHFSAYEFFSETQTELRQTLINSGIQLHQLPPGKTSNEMEKMMMADVLLWAMDTPPPANIIIIVGNVDFCYVFRKLRQRSYNVFLVCQSMSKMPQGMLGGVNDCLGWLSFLRSLQNEDQQSHYPGGICVYDHTFSNTAFPASSTSIRNRGMEESNNASYFNYSQDNLFSLQPSLSGGWDSTCIFPLDETAVSSPVQTELGFHGHFISTEKPRSPVSSASSTENKESGSLEEFKAWLAGVVNSIEHAENGYNISHIRMDFEKATSKILDKKLLGLLKIRNLVEECNDIAVLKEVKQGCHFAFPLELSTQKNLVSSPGGVNRIPSPEFKPEAETDPKLKQKASAEDFREFIYQMLLAGEFSQGFLLDRLRHKFEEQTGKVLDVKHLGYKKLSKLVASYSHLLSVDNAGTAFSRIFPVGFVSEAVPSNPNSNTSKVSSMNANHDPTKLKAKVEADGPSSAVIGNDLFKNSTWEETIFNKQLPYMNSESECLPSMTTGPRASVSFSPYREANSPFFQEYNSIKSDSSSTPGGSQVSEREGQSSNTISDMMSFHGELEGSYSIKQHVSALQLENNVPIENLVNAKCAIAQAMQNMSLMKENANFCREPSIHACTVGLADWNPPLTESPSSEPHVGCYSPLADPLQKRSGAESSAFCAEDLRYGIRLDCKQNELNSQENPVSSPGGVNQNLSSEFKPKAETDPKLKQKASAEDFREFIYQMLLAGEFSQGFVLGRLRHKFEEQTGKVLDVKHLGHKKMSKLVASYSHLLSVDNGGTTFSRIFPAGFVSEAVPSNPSSNTTSKVTSMNTNHDPSKLKAKVEADCPSSGVSGKELLKNRAWEENIFNKQLPYMNSENECLPSMTTGPLASVSFSPYIEANRHAFQEYNSIKSDFSSTPGGSQVSEREGQSSNTTSDMMSFHGELEGSNFIKQHVSTLQLENNDPIESLVDAECPMAEAMQNMSLMKENATFCGELSIHACTLGLPDWNPPLTESPSSEPHAGCNSPLADSLQRRSSTESSAFYAEGLRYGIRLDCKQNEINTQENPVSSPGGVNRNPSSEFKPKAETDPKLKQKATAEDFTEFIYQMLLAGEFSQGFVLGRLRNKFEEHTGKVLDVKQLGHKKLSKLVASYSHLLSVDNAGTTFSRIFPAGFVSEAVPSNPNSNSTSKVTSMNTNHDPTKLEEKVEVDFPSSGVSGKELLKNRAWEENIFNNQLPYMNSESECLPSMTTCSQASVSFSPYREANSPALQEYDSIKSDSSSTPGGSQVSEREGQSSNTISDMMPFHRELEGSNFIKQHVSTLQLENNDPIESLVDAECPMAEAMQNMSLMKENANFCGELSINACTLGLPDWNPPLTESPSSEPHAGCNSPLADSLQRRSSTESSAFYAEGLRYGIRLDCKQNEINTQENPVSSPGGVNRNPSSEFKPKAETDPKLKQKATAEDFTEFIYQMLLAGEFSQGFVLGCLRNKFEEHTGKVLDVKQLGHKKLSKLVASYSHLLSVDNAGTTFSRIFPAGFVSEAVPSNPNSNSTSKVTSMNTNHDPTKLEEKVEADFPSSGVSGKELLKNRAWEENIFNNQLPYMNSESECLPSMTTGSQASVSFSPYREANSPALQEYDNIKSDSSSTPGGSQVSEREGQSSNTISDMMSFHRELEGSNFIKQHVSTLQLENNDPIEDLVNAECPMEEAMQNMSLMKENAFFCGKPSIHACTLGIPDWNPPLTGSPTPEPYAGCNSPLADPLQRSRAESSAFCAEDLRYGIRLDCKQNELNTQEIPVSSPGGVNQNPSSEFKPKAETDPKLKQKASAEDFREFIYQMLLAGEFSQGFVLSSLRHKFEEKTGKVLDVKHLGHKKLSKLVASYSHLLSVDNAGTEFSQIFPAGFVSEVVPSNDNSNTTSKVTSMNTNHDPVKLKAKVEVDCPSSDVSGKELLENRAWGENIYIQQFPYMNSESEWLPDMTTGSQEPASFIPRQANSPAFQGCDIKSDSASTSGGFQVSEWEGQYSTTISETTFFHGEGSDCINIVLALQRDGNIPIEESVIAKHLKAEAMENRRLIIENTSFCREPSIPAGIGLPDSIPPSYDSPSSEPQAGCISPHAPRQNKAESNAVCAEDSRDSIRLDCKQNKKNTKSGANEESSIRMTSAVASAGSIIQVAGRGLKSICELTMWRKNR